MQQGIGPPEMDKVQIGWRNAQVNDEAVKAPALKACVALRAPQRGQGHELILDAAEALFAEKGYNGAGLREITAAAGVKVSLANYHFQSKAELYRRVLARRAPEFAADLAASLSAVLAGNASTAGILEAYIRPHLQKLTKGGIGWRNYIRLAAQSMLLSRHDELFDDAADIYQPVIRRYHAALIELLPATAAVDEGFHLFRMALLSFIACDVHNFGDEPALSREGLCQSLVAIFATGLAAPLISFESDFVFI